jgi:hypothetical protein
MFHRRCSGDMDAPLMLFPGGHRPGSGPAGCGWRDVRGLTGIRDRRVQEGETARNATS